MAKKAAKGPKKAAKKKTAKKASAKRKPARGEKKPPLVDDKTKEAFRAGAGVPMGHRDRGPVDVMEGVVVQRSADPYIPEPGAIYPRELAISSSEVAKAMAPTAPASVHEQCRAFCKRITPMFRRSAVVGALFDVGNVPNDVELEETMKALEEMAVNAVQLRNSLATHYHR